MEFISRNNRTIDGTKNVRVYRNLNNKKLSIKQGNLVVGYSDEILLLNVKPIISKKGRERVLIEKRKNVHAYLEGEIQQDIDRRLKDELLNKGNELIYNPYLYSNFVDKLTLKIPKKNIESLYITSDGKMFYL